MRHLVKPILLVLDTAVINAVTLAVFVLYQKVLNYITYSVYYFYLLAGFVFNFLKTRPINVTSL